MSKRTLRVVLTMEPLGKTRRGNPEHWRSLLECGHFVLRYHSSRLFIHGAMFLMKEEPPFVTRANCTYCATKKPPHFEELCLSDLDRLGLYGDRAALHLVLDDWAERGLNIDHYRENYPKEES